MLLTIFAFILHSATLLHPIWHKCLHSDTVLHPIWRQCLHSDTFLHPIWRQSGVVGVHREKTQRWIVLKRTAIAGF